MVNIRITQFYKTKPCPWYLKGRCERAEACRFAHSNEEKRALPDLSQTSVCTFLLQYGTCPVPDCRFAHRIDHLKATEDIYKTSLCFMFMRNRCQAGIHCRYAHGVHELRKTNSTSPIHMNKILRTSGYTSPMPYILHTLSKNERPKFPMHQNMLGDVVSPSHCCHKKEMRNHISFLVRGNRVSPKSNGFDSCVPIQKKDYLSFTISVQPNNNQPIPPLLKDNSFKLRQSGSFIKQVSSQASWPQRMASLKSQDFSVIGFRKTKQPDPLNVNLTELCSNRDDPLPYSSCSLQTYCIGYPLKTETINSSYSTTTQTGWHPSRINPLTNDGKKEKDGLANTPFQNTKINALDLCHEEKENPDANSSWPSMRFTQIPTSQLCSERCTLSSKQSQYMTSLEDFGLEFDLQEPLKFLDDHATTCLLTPRGASNQFP